MKLAAGFVALASSLALFAPERTASAFCRTHTQSTAVFEDGRECKPSGDNCCQLGKPIWWRNACIGFSMNAAATTRSDISAALARNTIAHAFNLWSSASCPSDEADSRVSIDVREMPVAECSDVKTWVDEKNQNVVIFRDTVWPHSDPTKTLGLTSVRFSPSTGEIYGADLEFNTANFDFACASPGVDPGTESCFDAPPPPNRNDFASVVTHELGHYFGIAHSNDPTATMATHYDGAGSLNFTLRTLTADDIAAICHAYPPGGLRRTKDDKGGELMIPQGPCDPQPRNGFISACAEEGCAVASVGAGVERRGLRKTLPALGALAVAVGIAWFRRRKVLWLRRSGR